MVQYLIISIIVIVFLKAYFPTIIVKGYSMYPTYLPEQVLCSRRITRFEKLQIGEVYVFYDPKEKDKVLIKRLSCVIKADLSRTEYCYFLGDNSKDSRDSREFGYVPRNKIIAIII